MAARHYRVVLHRKSMLRALMAGRIYSDWFIAECRGILPVWRRLGIFPSREEAEAACHDHAGGALVSGGGRIVSEFERPD